MKKIFAFALLGLASLGASAEKADAGKQAVIDYDTLRVDEVTQTSTLTGDVVVTKGTLLLRAEKAVVKQTPAGDMHVTLNAGDGKLATFRQKRDGGADLWLEGEAQKIEYDERNAVMKLFGKAKVRRLEGNKVTEEIKSEFISYDSLREEFLSSDQPGGVSKPGGARGRMIFTPSKRPAPAPAPAAPTTPVGTP
jgi:lipopolysaccharide export system protein LptA